jgi:hypothetical protein
VLDIGAPTVALARGADAAAKVKRDRGKRDREKRKETEKKQGVAKA